MELVIILTGGRAGSDFLQSLFDGHSQILQLPGILRFDEKLFNTINSASPEKIADRFILNYNYYFNSKLNKLERHHKLGPKKNSSYKINTRSFKKKFIKFYEKSKKRKFDIILSLHKAYCEKDINKKKILILHIHLFLFLKNFLKEFKDIKKFKILLMLRDPMASLSSTITNWLKFKKGKILTPKNLYTNFDTHFNNFNNLHFIRKNIRVIKLENLHTQSLITIKKICKFIKINYSKTLLKSTFNGKQWWGDSISKKYLKGLNPKFKNSFNSNIFDEKEIYYMESKLKEILQKYNYPIRSKKILVKKKFYLYPLKIEKIIWLKTFQLNNFKAFMTSLYFFIRRIVLFSKKNLYTTSKLPKEV